MRQELFYEENKGEKRPDEDGDADEQVQAFSLQRQKLTRKDLAYIENELGIDLAQLELLKEDVDYELVTDGEDIELQPDEDEHVLLEISSDASANPSDDELQHADNNYNNFQEENEVAEDDHEIENESYLLSFRSINKVQEPKLGITVVEDAYRGINEEYRQHHQSTVTDDYVRSKPNRFMARLGALVYSDDEEEEEEKATLNSGGVGQPYALTRFDFTPYETLGNDQYRFSSEHHADAEESKQVVFTFED